MDVEQILQLDTLELIDVIEKHLDVSHYGSKDDYIYYPSTSNLLLCSHVDTVRKEGVPLKIKRAGNVITAESSVLGADDRAGVWAMLEIDRRCKLENIVVPNLLFTNHEESGGTGMRELITAKDKYFKHIHMVIALDRTGCNEYVTYNHLPDEVSRYMESFGYRRGMGTFNDITYFTERYRIPSVNTSVGYYSAHTVVERLHMDELMFCISRMMDVIRNPIGKRYKTSKEKYYDYAYGYGDYDYYTKYTEKVDKRKGGYGQKQVVISEIVGDDYVKGHGICEICCENRGSVWIDEGGYGKTWACEDCEMWVNREDAYYLRNGGNYGKVY